MSTGDPAERGEALAQGATPMAPAAPTRCVKLLKRWQPLLLLLIAFVLVSTAVIPRVEVDGAFGDHSLSVIAGSTLSGAYDSLSAAADRPETKLVGLLAFVLEIVGAAIVLLVPRLRLLVLIPALLALVPWFLASRGSIAPFTAVTAFWPALLLGAATLAYIGWGWARPRVGATGAAAVAHARSAARTRRRALRQG